MEKDKTSRNINIIELGEKLKCLEKLITSHDKVRLTVYGTYNAGKSSTINSLIGKNLLQEDSDECTRKPILIRYSNEDKPKIYRAELLMNSDYGRFPHYSFIEKGKAIAESEEAVKNFIISQNILNSKKNNEENPYKDDYFILTTKIKILDDLGLSEEIKNNIEFIDTPGLGTGFFENQGELISKLISQTFIYIIVFDQQEGGTDSQFFKDALDTILGGTKYNKSRTIIKSDKTFPYLFIANKCEKENEEFNLENHQQNINTKLKTENLKYNICKFSAWNKKDVNNKVNEFTPENFINKAENSFYDSLCTSTKNFIDYLKFFVDKDLKSTFGAENFKKNNDEIQTVDSCQFVEEKLKEIIKNSDYMPNELAIPEGIVTKISKYLTFCSKNYKKLPLYNKKMMDDFESVLKSKIITAYEFIKVGYKNQVKIAIELISNFLGTGIIPDKVSKRESKEDYEKAILIVQKIRKCFEEIDIIKTLEIFSTEINDTLNKSEKIDENYENIFKEKQNYLNDRYTELINKTIPKMSEELGKKVSNILDRELKFDYQIENNKIVLKEEVYGTKGEHTKTIILGLGTAVSGALTAVTAPLALFGLLFAFGEQNKAKEKGKEISFDEAMKNPFTAIFGAPCVAFAALTGYLGEKTGKIFSGRFEASYKKSIENLRSKFFAEFNGYKIKKIEEYNSFKESIIQTAASYLNMKYYPVTISADEKERLLEKFNLLKEELNKTLENNY